MSKYDDFLNEPQTLSDRSIIFHGDLSIEECKKQGDEIGIDVDIKNLVRDRIRFGFPPENVEDRESLDGPCWFTGASGRGSKEVWRLKQ